MDFAAAAACGHENHRHLSRLYVDVQMAAKPGRVRRLLRESYATRIHHENHVWAAGMEPVAQALFEQYDLDAAITYAISEWRPSVAKRLWGAVRKETPEASPNQQEIANRLATGVNYESWAAGAATAYLGLAMQTSEEAGQMSLRHLGLNKTWAWAHPQNMAQDMFAVRGSKVVQNMYGAHLNRLSSMIMEATNPRTPKTIQHVRQQIKQEWPALQRYQVDRIARTETAAVWTTTQANAYQANGISQFESLIAQGPSIGVESEDPCDECVDMAASIHDMTDDIPPWHPNCRCEIVPSLEDADGNVWLPPAEPFTGGAEGMELSVCDSPIAKARGQQRARLLKMGAVLKAAPNCLIPAPAPGEPLGGIKYHEVGTEVVDIEEEEAGAMTLAQLQDGVTAWPDAAARAAGHKVIDTTLGFAENEGMEMGTEVGVLAATDAGGSPLSLAGWYLGATDEGLPALSLVGVASKSGGARKMVEKLARTAHDQGAALSVDTTGISPQLKNILTDQWGFMPEEGVPDYVTLPHSKLKSTFKIEDEVPHAPAPTAPTVTPVAPPEAAGTVAPQHAFPAGSVPEAKVKLTSTNNKISGVKTRIKQATAKGEDAKLQDLQKRLQDLYDERESLKAYIKTGGKSAGEPVYVPAVVPEAPVAAVTALPVEVPPEKVIEYTQPKKGTMVPGTLKKEPGTGKLTRDIGGGSVSVQNKQAVADRLERRMLDIWRKKHPEMTELQAAADLLRATDALRRAYDYGTAFSYYRDSPLKDAIARMVQNWARTSSDADARGVAMQIAAKEELGLDVRVFAASHWGDAMRSDEIVRQARNILDGRGTFSGGNYIDQTTGDDLNELMRTFIRAQYEETQAYFKEQGITDLTLYRGLRPARDVPWPVGVSVLRLEDNPMASWSTKLSVAKRSNFYSHTMLRASVPADMVLSTPLTGFGCSNEFEAVVLNAGDNKAWVTRVGNTPMTAERRADLLADQDEAQRLMSYTLGELQRAFPDLGVHVGSYHGIENTLAYGTKEYIAFHGSERYTLYRELGQKYANARQARDNATHQLSQTNEYFSWSKETDLVAAIQKELDKNAALAGKPLKPLAAETRPPLRFDHPYAGDAELADYVDVYVGEDEAGKIQYVGGTGLVAEFGGETKTFYGLPEAKQWITDQYEEAYGKIKKPAAPKGGGGLTPEKRARNKVSSTKFQLNKLQQQKTAYVNDEPVDLPDSLAGGSYDYVVNWLEKRIAAAQQKYEQAQIDLDQLLAEQTAKARMRALLRKARVPTGL